MNQSNLFRRILRQGGALFLLAGLTAPGFGQEPSSSYQHDLNYETNRLTVFPSFQSASYYFIPDSGTAADDWRIAVREAGGTDWIQGLPPVFSRQDAMWRGSLVDLKEDTPYEICLSRSSSGGETDRPPEIFPASFRTWTSNPPIARTIRMEDLWTNGSGVVLTHRGSAEGWIRITSDSDAVWKAPTGTIAAIHVLGAAYLILDHLRIEGGDQDSILIENSEQVRIQNCDLSAWGRVGKQDLNKDGKYYRDGRTLNNHAGVHIRNSAQTVVERCYIHDPNAQANTWTYAHPEGPNAVFLQKGRGTVLRYNDLVGSPGHEWNDVVEGSPNAAETGGFYRDGDVYGNFFAFGNDDGIELDGGQMNLRVYENLFVGTYCGISTAPCLLGPSYLFRNLIRDLGDHENRSYTSLKNHHQLQAVGRVFMFHNTAYQQSGPVQSKFASGAPDGVFTQDVKCVMRNNVLMSGGDLFGDAVFLWKNDWDGDLFWSPYAPGLERARLILEKQRQESNGILQDPLFVSPENGLFQLQDRSPGKNRALAIPGFSPAGGDLGAFDRCDRLPNRPIPIRADRMHVFVNTDANGTSEAQTIQVTRVGETTADAPFTIRVSPATPWLLVTPGTGVVTQAAPLTLTVRVRFGANVHPGLFRSAFLIRLPNGLSIPVTVTAQKQGTWLPQTDTVGTLVLEAERAEGSDGFQVETDPEASGHACVMLAPAENAEVAASQKLKFMVDIPVTGRYWMSARIRSDSPVANHDSLGFSIDDAAPQKANLRSALSWVWSGVTADTQFPPLWAGFQFDAGRHTITLTPRESVRVDLLMLTRDPDLAEELR